MIDTDKYEGHLADALVAVREGGVDCDFSKIRIEDALGDMADLLAEVKRLREENDLLRSMQRDGMEASAHDRLLLEINRLRERVKTEKNLNLWEKAEVKRLREELRLTNEWLDRLNAIISPQLRRLIK